MKNRILETFTVADTNDRRYKMHLVQEYKRIDSLNGPEIIENMRHYECQGHLASRNPDGSFWITGIDITVWPVDE